MNIKKLKKIKQKCEYFGLVYLGYWDNTHWAMKPDHKHAVYLGGMIYSVTT